MKTWLFILFFCSYYINVSAQSIDNNYLKIFVQDTTDNTYPTGYRLIKLRQPTDKYILPGLSLQIARQLSNVDFIVKTFNKQLSANPGIIYTLPANNNWKLSPHLLTELQNQVIKKNETYQFQLQVNNIIAIKKLIEENKSFITIVREYENLMQIETSYHVLNKIIVPNDMVTFINVADRIPKNETNINGFDNSVNTVNKLHSVYPGINGKGIVVSVKENKPDTADIDFKGRFLSTTLSSPVSSTHASIMSTIIGGGGNSSYTAKGVAWGGTISSSSFTVLLPDNDAAYLQYKISVQNHSYGTGIENFYGADAAAYDASVNNNPSLMHVFSSGNSGNLISTSGQYNGINGFANLTGSFKMAKNIITVGSIDSFYSIPVLSSKGPAYDGRVKPELVAFGEDGSSGAAALVSGTALVLQDAYKEQHSNFLPDASLVKAILLNTADDVGNTGVDFLSGYGSLNAYRAIKVMQSNQFFSGAIAQGQSQTYTITVPGNAKNFKTILVWTDKPAAGNAFTALINDLDLSIKHFTSGQSWQPWVLSSVANKDSLQLLPVRKRDSLNTAEQIIIDAPLPGDYIITVNGFNIPSGMQKFFIAYQWDTANTFEWTYPTKNDNLLPGRQNVLRWQNNYTSTGQLEYKVAGSNNWQTVSTNFNIVNGYFKWITPDTNAVGLLRMIINGQQYISDTFTISSRLQTGVGFNCPDSFLLYWSKAPTNKYNVYKLGDKYLEEMQTLADTSIILNKLTDTARWYAIAPLLPYNKEGIKSFSFDYTQQGVECYIKNFTADLINNVAELNVTLSSYYNVVSVTVEKLTANGYQPLKILTLPIVLQYTINDNNLIRGLNTYRVKIELANGKIIYNENESVYYFNNNNYIIYPNPVKQGEFINIVSATLNNPTIQFFNAYGQKIFEKKLYNLVEQIQTNQFGKGIYFYIIWKDGIKDANGKIIIQ